MGGTDQGPQSWPITATQGDLLLVEGFDVNRVVGEGSSKVVTPAVITSALATCRLQRHREATLVLDMVATYSGNSVRWGGVRVPTRPGSWWWDLQVIGTFGSDPFDLTLVSGKFTILRDTAHGS